MNQSGGDGGNYIKYRERNQWQVVTGNTERVNVSDSSTDFSNVVNVNNNFSCSNNVQLGGALTASAGRFNGPLSCSSDLTVGAAITGSSGLLITGGQVQIVGALSCSSNLNVGASITGSSLSCSSHVRCGGSITGSSGLLLTNGRIQVVGRNFFFC